MAGVSVQASNMLKVVEKLGRMAYKKMPEVKEVAFEDYWQNFKTKNKLEPKKVFFKSDKVKTYKINLSESNAKLILSIMAYMAACLDAEEYESVRLENNRIWMNLKYDTFECLTLDAFLHKDKLCLSILAEPS